MNIRNTDIAQKLGKWLERYAVPMHLREKPEAAQAEAESLARILCKYAPGDEYQPFLNRVFDALDGQMKHRIWPTGQEMGAACVNLRKEGSGRTFDGGSFEQKSPQQIIAERMARGDAVGEGYLYGIAAVELIADRLVDESTMKAYRSGAFFARKATYGEAAAVAWEIEAKARHEAAKDMFRQRGADRGHGAEITAKHFGAA